MCGIVGYTGIASRDGHPDGRALTRLEYRGYDSAGVAVEQRRRAGGRALQRQGRAGCAGSWWPRSACRAPAASATRAGPPTAVPREENAHPHVSVRRACRRRPQRHHRELRRAARGAGWRSGHAFTSETDTEVLAAPRGRGLRGRLRPAAGRARRARERARSVPTRSAVVCDRRARARSSPRARTRLIVVGRARTARYVASDIIAADRRHARRGRPGATASSPSLTPDGDRVLQRCAGERVRAGGHACRLGRGRWPRRAATPTSC